MTEQVQSISLYRHAGAKALIQPCSESSAAALFTCNEYNKHLVQASATQRGGGLRLKFLTSSSIWRDLYEASVLSHRMFLDIVLAMQRKNMQYLCCADLNLRGVAAGTHFFQRVPPGTMGRQELACLQLANVDKIRIVQLPISERKGLSQTISKDWPYSVTRQDKYGLEVYKLGNRPWATMETSQHAGNVAARKLLIQILANMDRNGWSRVVPFNCTTSDRNVDSLLFYRNDSTPVSVHREFCAVSLERSHKIRLIGGTDETTQATFAGAVSRGWGKRVKEANRFSDSMQIKLLGHPWKPQTTPEHIASAKLVCGVLQSLWQLGWRWHCAVDLSVSIADKSTFFLSRPRGGSQCEDFGRGLVGCVQPKGRGEVNLVSVPPSALNQVVQNIQKARWNVPLLKVERHCSDSATIHFGSQELHRSQRTDEKLNTAEVYTELLRVVASAREGTTMLGTGDISANFHSHTDANGHTTSYSLDTDAFFLWFPV